VVIIIVKWSVNLAKGCVPDERMIAKLGMERLWAMVHEGQTKNSEEFCMEVVQFDGVLIYGLECQFKLG